LKKGLNVSSWEYRMQTAVMDALVDLQDPDVYDDLVRFSKDPYSRDTRAVAIRGLGRLAGKIKKNENKTLNLLLEYLKSPADSIRQAAISGLQDLGKEDAIPQLRWVEQNDGEKHVREAAGRAAAEIRKGKDGDLAAQNAGRIDKLEDQNKKLEDRLRELETQLKTASSEEKKAKEKNEESKTSNKDK
jgi:HEAT repeat protein